MDPIQKENIPNRLAIAIKWYLRTFNITQKQVAEKTQISESNLCRFFKGKELSLLDYKRLEQWLLSTHDPSESN